MFLAVVWFCSGGVVLFHHQYYRPAFYKQGDWRPLILVDFHKTYASYGVPLLFQYHTDRLPFALKLQYVTHNVVSDSVLQFDRLEVVFADGSALDLRERIGDRIPLTRYVRQFLDDANVRQECDAIRALIDLGDCIDSRQTFTFYVAGDVTADREVTERFEAAIVFESKEECDVNSGWEWIAGDHA